MTTTEPSVAQKRDARKTTPCGCGPIVCQIDHLDGMTFCEEKRRNPEHRENSRGDCE